MKIVTLNIWGGRMHEPLMRFLADRRDIDIFCFQEVYHEAHGKDTIWLNGTNFDSFADLQDALPGYQAFYHPHLEDWWGLAMFVRDDIPVLKAGEHFVHLHKGHDLEIEKLGHTAKNVQYVTVQAHGRPLTVLNFHGLWNGKGKTDTEERLRQSEKIVEFGKGIPHDYVLCGDFNLLPETESLKRIEKGLGARNLIAEFGITSTRTALYPKPDKFADYVFTSPGVAVQAFTVLPDELSDHAALCLETR